MGFYNFIRSKVEAVTKKYYPLYYLPNGTIQTLLAFKLKPKKTFNFEKEVLTNEDGGQFMLAWESDKAANEKTQNVVLIYPGILGSINSNYVHSITDELQNSYLKEDFVVAVITNRGFDVLYATPKAFSVNNTDDLKLALENIKGKCPNASVYGIGFSLGGTIMLNYLSKYGEKSLLDATFLCGPPFNSKSSEDLSKGFYWLVFGYLLTRQLTKANYLRSKHVFDGYVDHDVVSSSSSILSLNSSFIVKTNSYKDLNDYYTRSAITDEKILKIKTPTLILMADDDKVSDYKTVPYEAVKKSEYVVVEVTNGGGHLSFMAEMNCRNNRYHFQTLIDYFNALDECNIVELLQGKLF